MDVRRDEQVAWPAGVGRKHAMTRSEMDSAFRTAGLDSYDELLAVRRHGSWTVVAQALSCEELKEME